MNQSPPVNPFPDNANGPGQDRVHWQNVRTLARRTDPKEPGGPPWAWPNLNAQEAGWLDDALDEFVNTYNRIHVALIDEVIPACWRLHPPLAQEMPVQFWSWWSTHIDAKATIAMAVDYYTRTLPTFQTRLTTRLLGKGAVNCRKGKHTRNPDPAITDAISFDPAGTADDTGRGEPTRRTLRHQNFGTGQTAPIGGGTI